MSQVAQRKKTGPQIIEGWEALKKFILENIIELPIPATIYQIDGLTDYTNIKKIEITLDTDTGKINLNEKNFKKMEIKKTGE